MGKLLRGISGHVRAKHAERVAVEVIHHAKFQADDEVLQREVVEEEILVQILEDVRAEFKGELGGDQNTVDDFEEVGDRGLGVELLDTQTRGDRTRK